MVIEIAFQQRHSRGAAHGRAILSGLGVAQSAHQVAARVVTVKQPRASEHPGERVLDEVLRILVGPAQPPRYAVKPLQVIGE